MTALLRANRPKTDQPDILLVSEEEPYAYPRDSKTAYRKHLRFPQFSPVTPRAGGGLCMPHGQHLSIVALGTYLQRHGIQPVVVDNIFRIKRSRDIFDRTLKDGVPVVGISTTLLMTWDSIAGIVNEARRLNPNAKIILGGQTAARDPRVRELADIVVIGDGELALLNVMRAIKSGGALEKIKNLLYKDEMGNWSKTPTGSSMQPNDIPAPNWGLLETRPSPTYPIEASKGCRYHCAFCSYPDLGNQRLRDTNLVIQEIVENIRHHHARALRFVDSNLTSWPEYTERLCDEIIQSGVDIPWSCYARVDNLAQKPSLADKMRRAGCVMIFSGIESGSDEILHGMKKGYGSEVIFEGVRRAKDAGILVQGNFIIGFPGETHQSVDRTLEVIRRTEIDMVIFQPFSPPGHFADRHDSMDPAEARFHVDRAMDMVDSWGNQCVVAAEWDVLYLISLGLKPKQAAVYFSALRDLRMAEKSHDSRSCVEAEAIIRHVAEISSAHLRQFALLDPARALTADQRSRYNILTRWLRACLGVARRRLSAASADIVDPLSAGWPGI